MNNETLYDKLQIPQTSSADDIKKAYRKLSLKYHPDKNRDTDSVQKFHEISEAYEVLSDPMKKQQYDHMALRGFKHDKNMEHFQEVFDLDELFSKLFSMNGPSPFQPFPMNSNTQHFPNSSMKFNVNHIQTQLSKPPPIVQTILLEIAQICEKQTIPIEIDRWIMEGNTKLTEKETIYIEIPEGADENEIIILRDKGNINHHGISGDVKIFINIQNNTMFKRTGVDLEIIKNISLREALCGFTFDLVHLNGKRYTINNEKGNVIKPNYNKVIPNLGLKRGDKMGSLIIQFVIIFPEKIALNILDKLDTLLVF